MLYQCYATIVRRNMHSQGNNIQSIARHLSMTIEGLLEAVFSVGSTLRLYSEDPKPADSSSVESQLVKRRLGGWYEMTAIPEHC
jgi:hypothetical protein